MLLERHGGSEALFARHDLEAQIAAALEPTVALPSGAGLAIEQTQALGAIAVYTGRVTGPSRRDDTARRGLAGQTGGQSSPPYRAAPPCLVGRT